MTMHNTITALSQPSFRQRFFWTLVAVSMVFAALYMYFIASAIVHVVMRGEVAQDIASASTRVSQLEAIYLASAGTITPTYAAEAGFSKLEEKTFAVKTDVRVAGISFSNTQD